MKKIFIFLGLLTLLYTLRAQQQIENSNFEIWTDVHHPQNWNCTIDIGYLDIYTAERTNDAYNGNYAVNLTTQSAYGYTIPGIIQLGELVLQEDTVAIQGGYPFSARPTGLRAFIKYTPVNRDTAFIISYLTRYDTATNSTDTIGGTFYPITDTVAEYTEINVPFIYKDTTMSDTINIICLSSNPFNPQAGSQLIVDSIYLIYEFYAYPTVALPATNISDTAFTANWYPSPLSSEYYLDVATDTNFVNILPDYNNIEVTGESFQVTIDGNSKKYFYRVRVKYGDTATSINSNIISVSPLYAPVALPATELTTSSFHAHWNSVPGAQRYYLDVASDMDFQNYVTGYENFPVQDTTYIVTGLSDTLYYYRVRAEYAAGISGNSNVIAVILPLAKIKEITLFENYRIKNNTLYLYDLLEGSKISIYDINGRLIYRNTAVNSEISIPFKQKGVYILRINNGKKDKILKFTI